MARKQTLVQAIHLAFSGKDRELGRAIHYLDGKPAGASGETEEAHRHVVSDLPVRRNRSYTAGQFVEAAYSLEQTPNSGGRSYWDRYRTRSYDDALAEAARIEAEAAG